MEEKRVAFAKEYRAPFIVIEGTDGSGISTQTGLVATALRARKVKVCVTKQPSNGPIGVMIRLGLAKRLDLPREVTMSPEVQAKRWALFFAADRLDHFYTEVAPKVNKGITVVCDRYDLSSYAYQGSVLKDFEWIRAINQHIRRPDLIVVLRVPPTVALKRIEKRDWEFQLFESEAKLAEVYDSYDRAIEFLRDHGDNIVEVDGARSAEEVHASVMQAIEEALGNLGQSGDD